MAVDTGRGRWRRRRNRPTPLAMLVVGALAALALTACGSSDADSNSSGGKGGTLTIGIDRALASLNTATDSGASAGGFILYMPYATLIQKDPEDGTYHPGLAESFGYVGEGNTTYELKLRSGLKFSDGVDVTAAAVKAWFDYFPTAGGGYATLLDIKSVQTPDDLTVRINLRTPTPLVTEALSQAWGMVPSPEAVKDPDVLNAGAPGAGPYKYDPEATVTGAGASYTFVPNEYYDDQDAIKWEKVVVKVIEDPATRLRAVQSGEIDVAAGSTGTIAAAEDAGLDVSRATAGWVAVEIIDASGTKSEALGDVRVRQALNYAVDREAIVEAFYDGAVEPTSTPVTADGFQEELQDRYPYDPEKAKDLLAAAGYPDGFSFTMVAASATSGPLAQALSQNWADIGVKVDLVSTSTNTEFFEKFLTESAFIVDFPVGLGMTLATARYTPASPLNPYQVDDSALNELFGQALTAAPDDLGSIMVEYMDQVTEQAYSVPIATNLYSLYSNGDKVAGVNVAQWLNASAGVLEWSAP